MKVLIADDSEALRKVLKKILAKMGISDVELANDGREAVDAVIRSEFDLILMDWCMPNVSGIEAIKEIRAIGKKMPILMITGEHTEAHKEEAAFYGATDYITKPFRIETVRHTIEQLLK